MSSFRSSMLLLVTALSALTSLSPVAAAPAPALVPKPRQAASSFWMADIGAASKGTVWQGNNSDYQVFRNVVDLGVDNSGNTDVTAKIQSIIADGGRCGLNCNSSTTTPAIIYFPPGTYLISTPIKMFYMTQMIGDANNKPILKASGDFAGMGMLDADPYEDSGANWYTNQNNFYRQVRNFVIDLTGSTDTATGIHWQVAQATSIQNVDFNMKPGSKQQGIFMDNGSGGFFSDLTFTGGKFGAFLGSQQFTSRNLIFKNCDTAIFMNWNWGWTLSNVSITGGTTGIDMSNSPANQTVGSVLLTDSTITGATYGIKTAYGGNSTSSENIPTTGGTLVLDNVDMSGVTTAAVYQNATDTVILAPGKITAWAQGNGYDHTTTNNKFAQTTIKAPTKAASLLDASGNIFGRSKPQYENVPSSNFWLAKRDGGCAGDGETDDSGCINKFLQAASSKGFVAYFEHGAYLLKDTVTTPNNVKITGEIWPLIMADGPSFNDPTNPKPVFQIGTAGSKGAVEISDLIFQTKGPAPGAVMIEWNLNSAQGDSGMWDAHVRIGGSAGTELLETQCPGWPTTQASDQCMGVFIMFHATKSSGGVYLENDWLWVADHSFESDPTTGLRNQTQISIYSARGALFESQGPVWLWGTASEHSVLYNYQVLGVKAFFGGFMQSETPYFQPAPMAPAPFSFNSTWDDPTFTICPASGVSADGVACKDAWGLRVINSQGVLIYATGMYSFFNNYGQACVAKHNCQEYMIRIQNSQVDMYTVTTKAAVNMIADDRFPGKPILGADNRDVFGDTLAFYSTG